MNDEDIDKFLHSKVKRGRGAVGSRMDEPGPYRAHTDAEVRRKEDWEARIATTRPVAGPSLPPPESRKKQKKLDVSDSDDDDEVARKRLRRERKKEKRNSEKHESKKKKKRRR